MHRQRSRGRARHGRLVDDAHLHAKMAEPQRQHQAGRPRPDDQDFDFWFHGYLAAIIQMADRSVNLQISTSPTSASTPQLAKVATPQTQKGISSTSKSPNGTPY